ncbi:MAG: hypothetical protein SOW12_01010 [Lachnospiraceae bacterium]|nr:hypothetical protein [Lachnospiraceae bacterium]
MISDKSRDVFDELMKRKLPETLCHEIAYKYMNTDYTATRMLGYLYRHSELTQEMIVDEMIAILEDRDYFRKKHEAEEANAYISRLYNTGLDDYYIQSIVEDDYGCEERDDNAPVMGLCLVVNSFDETDKKWVRIPEAVLLAEKIDEGSHVTREFLDRFDQ